MTRDAMLLPLGLSAPPKQVTRSFVDVLDPRLIRLRNMRRTVTLSAEMLHAEASRGGRRPTVCFVTLTYHRNNWRAGHISRTLNAVSMWHARRGITPRYVWVAELQRRGVIHYHLMFWLPRGYWLPKFDRRGWWPHGSTNVKAARSPVGYLAKYASKGTPAQRFPHGARIHGSAGLTIDQRIQRRWMQAPPEARLTLGPAADIHRIKGGRVDRRTGALWLTPWRVELRYGAVHLYRINDHEPQAHHQQG